MDQYPTLALFLPPQANPRTLLCHGLSPPSGLSLSIESEVPTPRPQDSPSLLSLGNTPKIVRIDPTFSSHGPKFLHTGTSIGRHIEGHRNPGICRVICTDASWHTRTHIYGPAPLVPSPSRCQYSDTLTGGFRQTPPADRNPEFESPHLFSLKCTAHHL